MRRFFSFMVMILPFVFFESCNKDNDVIAKEETTTNKVPSQFVGTWIPERLFDTAYTYYITLNADESYSVERRGDSAYDVNYYSGKWSYDENKHLILQGTWNITFYVESITSTYMDIHVGGRGYLFYKQ